MMHRLRTLLLAFAALCLASVQVEGTIWTVEKDGTGNFQTIQEAIDVAAAGDEVVVGPGTYTDLHPDSRGTLAVAELKSGVAVRSSDGPGVTVIDAYAEGERRGVSAYEVDAGASLEGFAVTRGDAPVGGGIYLFESEARISRNRVIENDSGAGAGIVCEGASAPLIEENEVVDNFACCGEGGGILCTGGSSARLLRNEVRGNQGFGGGGIGLSQAGEPQVIDNLVVANIGLAGGGIGVIGTGGLIEGNRILENEAQQGGGMISWSGGEAVFSHNVVARNTSMADGGGYHISADSPRLVNETIVANVSFLGAGIFIWNDSAPRIERTIVAFGIDGEGIWVDDPSSSAEVACCDVYGNALGEYGGFLDDPTGTDGNLSVDPLFCGMEDGDYRLGRGSPLWLQVSATGGGCGPIGALSEKCRNASSRGVVFMDDDFTPFPNPSGGRVLIPRAVNGRRLSAVGIVDLGGRRIRTLRASGTEAFISWDGRDQAGRAVPSGVYFIVAPQAGVEARVLLRR